MKTKKSIIIGFAGIMPAVIGMSCGSKEGQMDTLAAEQGVVEISVTATGYIQPVEVVEVGTQVSGVIEKIYTDFNAHVKKGQLLAELDKLTLQEKLNQATASLHSAQSELDYARSVFERTKQLYEGNAATKASYEEATNKLTQAQTTLDNARATYHQAKVDLSYAYIYSPIDGVVLHRAVNTGQTVAAMFATPTLFTIAKDLTKMQVEADVDEADMGKVKLGQRVSFAVDAYTDLTFEGTVSQIRLQPKVTNGVVTYTVIVDAPNLEGKLFPGMTANISVEVDVQKGITVPIEALSADRRSVMIAMNGKAEQRAIETGINDGINIIVQSGIREGEGVVKAYNTGKK
ncbi:macrolide-specific efflux protein MacA [Candidatus Symbiothrix dinenymphae]|nr:macrolide-specific efflux protein MacA [Candidatus Symbiothrix dinenymphae]